MELPIGFKLTESAKGYGFTIFWNVLLEPVYQVIWPLNQQVTAFLSNGKWGLICLDGHFVEPCHDALMIDFYDGFQQICITDWLRGKYFESDRIPTDIMMQQFNVNMDSSSIISNVLVYDKIFPCLIKDKYLRLKKYSTFHGDLRVELFNEVGSIVVSDRFTEMGLVTTYGYSIVESKDDTYIFDINRKDLLHIKGINENYFYLGKRIFKTDYFNNQFILDGSTGNWRAI